MVIIKILKVIVHQTSWQRITPNILEQTYILFSIHCHLQRYQLDTLMWPVHKKQQQSHVRIVRTLLILVQDVQMILDIDLCLQ